MPNQEIIERFRNHGIDIDNYGAKSRVPEKLSQTDPETLWLVVEDFSEGKPIGMQSPNEKAHQLTLSYALFNAYENDELTITQEDIDRAAERAKSTMERMVKGSYSKADTPKTDDGDSSSETGSKPTKSRKRSKTLMPNVKAVVQDNTNAETDDLIELIQKREPQAAENTIRAYISKARKELGLATGKRGRKPSKLYPTIKSTVQDNPDATVDEVGEVVSKALDKEINPNTLLAYYNKARKELDL